MKTLTYMAALATGLLTMGATGTSPALGAGVGQPISTERIDGDATRMMAQAKVQGLAMAVIDDGKVEFVRSWGKRNVEKNLPLQTDTIMYGASLTKFAFAYMVMQLVDEGSVGLDTSIADYLPKPLPEYPFYAALHGDERWRKLTPRILLSHTSGLANFAFLEPDGKMRFHFEPGSRYAYSGEGIILLQFVLETGLGLKVGDEMQKRVFDRFGMTRTSMMWREDFASNLADGYGIDGAFEAHDQRSRPRAAGSMDTTIADFAKFLAGFVRGDGLSAKSRAEMVKAQLPITTPTQFPTFSDRHLAGDAGHQARIRPGRDHLRRSDGPRLLQGRPQRHHRQPGDLRREESPLRAVPVQRRPRGEHLPASRRGDARRPRHAVVVGGLHALRPGARGVEVVCRLAG